MGTMGPRRVSIKTKLAAALAVPLMALSVVAGLEVMRSLEAADEVRKQTDLATASIGPSGLINALQHERNYSALWLLGADVFVDLPVDSLAEARAATDAARSAFALEVADKGEEVARIYSPALAELDRLTSLRDSVDAYTGPRIYTEFNQVAEDSFLGYSDLVTALADRNSELVTEVEDHELRRGVQLIDMSSREIDHIAKFVRLGLLGAVRGDRRLADPAEISDASMAITAALNNHYAILDFARGPYEAAGKELEVESAATGVIEMGPRIVETGTVDIPAMLTGISLEDDESYYGFLTDVSNILQARADHLNDVAAARSRWYIAAAALVVAAAVVAILAVSRSIVGPLKDLTRQSIAMAERHLPDAVRKVLEAPVVEDLEVPHVQPVTVRSRDEVADVAETLNTVQNAALDLAVDQAILRRNVADAFVNLARRNQNLIARQLDFITELERNETRTTALENLFKLDHHATRMRRNAESLLVLAGAEGARKWSGPVNLTDVVRAAVGEVEDFRRVVITTMDGASVVGSVASDLAHLLAELIDNAIQYSPPDRTVEVNGRTRGGGYLLLVKDDGIGMDNDEMAAANDRLEFGAPTTIAPSRYLGHYVAGNLARRHGVSVRLHATPCAGVTAAVELPPALVTGEVAGPVTGYRPAVLEEHAPAPLAGAAEPAEPSGPPTPAPLPPLPPLPSLTTLPSRTESVTPPVYEPIRPPAPVTVDLASRVVAPRVVRSDPHAPPLTRRVPGAQPPVTEVHGMSRTDAPGAGPGANGHDAGAPAPGSPDDVYRLLTDYADGVRRGHDEVSVSSPST
jgi:signal transduction histidine kinase